VNPGIYRNMSNAEYHGTPALSATGLKRLLQSPAHYYGTTLDPERPPQEPSPAMLNGTYVHCALLEPSELVKRYAVRPEGLEARTKDGKVWIAEAEARGLVVVTQAQEAAALRQARAVRALPDVASLLAQGEAEVSAFWTDPETGELCKCRPDWVRPAGDGVILVDGKTCQDASPEGFGRAIWNFRYDLQAAWYSDGYERATGLRVHGFVFAAVESAWPHAAAAYMLSEEVLDAARRKNRELLNLYAECKRTNTWPGYSPAIQQINLPPWAMKGIEA